MNEGDLIQAFTEGRKAERKVIAQWLKDKAYFTLSDLIRAGVHIVDPITEIRPLTKEERRASILRESKNKE